MPLDSTTLLHDASVENIRKIHIRNTCLFSKNTLTLVLDKSCDNVIFAKDNVMLNLHNCDYQNNTWISFGNAGKTIVNTLSRWLIPKYHNTTFDITCIGELVQLLPEMKPYVDNIILNRTYVLPLEKISLDLIDSTIKRFLSEELDCDHDITASRAYINLNIVSYYDSDDDNNEDHFYIDITGNSIVMSSQYTPSLGVELIAFADTMKCFCAELGNMTTGIPIDINCTNKELLEKELDTGSFYIFSNNDQEINPSIIQTFIVKLTEYYPTLHIDSFTIEVQVPYSI